MIRRIIALAAVVDSVGQHTVFASADDGTFWQYDPHHPAAQNAWVELQALPQWKGEATETSRT